MGVTKWAPSPAGHSSASCTLLQRIFSLAQNICALSIIRPLSLKLGCSCVTYWLLRDGWWGVTGGQQFCCRETPKPLHSYAVLIAVENLLVWAFKLYFWWHAAELDTSNLLNLPLSPPWLSTSVSFLHFGQPGRVKQYCSNGCNHLEWPWFHPWADSVGSFFFPLE